MDNKKTIIFGLIAVVALTGVVWYVSQNKQDIQEVAEQTASISMKEKAEQIAEAELVKELVLGSPEAPVTIIEYSSHFCGHCANFHIQTLPLLMDKYIEAGQVKLIFRPLSPPELGMAVLCAGEQGNFQEFNEYLFEHAQELKAVDDLRIITGTLNLNQDDFNQCFDSNKYEEKVMSWFTQAQENGVGGTPTFFINDQQIVGNQPYSVFEGIIEQELAK